MAAVRELTAAGLILLCSETALAQAFRVGVDAINVIPLGNFSDTYAIGFGALLRLESQTPVGFVFTARSGYIPHLTKAGDEIFTNVKLSEVPILVGAKFYNDAGLCGSLEIGGTSITRTISRPGRNDSGTSFAGSAALGIGLLIGRVDLQLSLRSVDLGNMTNGLEFGLGVGFNVLSL